MINAVDLFSGAGGFSLGLEHSGINIVGAVEIDRFATETYKRNFPGTPIINTDIRTLSDSEIINNFGGVDFIVGGPPCQGFSVAGPSQYGNIDPRNQLINEVFRFVKVIRPAVCLIENVKGILNGKLTPNRKAIDEYISRLISIGYYYKILTLQTADFGVPQWRERVFIFAVKSESYIPDIIEGTFGNSNNPWRTVNEALSDLPIVHSGEGTDEMVQYTIEAKCEYQRQMRAGSPGIFNHVAMKHTPRLIERFKHIPVGCSLADAPPAFGQRLRNSNILDVRQRFKMNNQRLDPNEISTAITASFQSNFIHPSLDRNLTAREGARLQSFPDSFVFCGPRTLMSKKLLEREGREEEIGLSQYNQIGNAVPPLLAEAIGKEIIAVLEGRLNYAAP